MAFVFLYLGYYCLVTRAVVTAGSISISTWEQVGTDLSGITFDDEHGACVSLSSDASRFAVASPGADNMK
jgi:hypothetical protein